MNRRPAENVAMLEVIGPPDRQTRIAAEWWYLFYTFGQSQAPGMHFTAA
jgi:hypothetical protein